jgi:hypothetical protein
MDHLFGDAGAGVRQQAIRLIAQQIENHFICHFILLLCCKIGICLMIFVLVQKTFFDYKCIILLEFEAIIDLNGSYGGSFLRVQLAGAGGKPQEDEH